VNLSVARHRAVSSLPCWPMSIFTNSMSSWRNIGNGSTRAVNGPSRRNTGGSARTCSTVGRKFVGCALKARLMIPLLIKHSARSSRSGRGEHRFVRVIRST